MLLETIFSRVEPSTAPGISSNIKVDAYPNEVTLARSVYLLRRAVAKSDVIAWGSSLQAENNANPSGKFVFSSDVLAPSPIVG